MMCEGGKKEDGKGGSRGLVLSPGGKVWCRARFSRAKGRWRREQRIHERVVNLTRAFVREMEGEAGEEVGEETR
jgi:hypothetical protein